MKTSRLFHTIVLVGAAMTAPAGLMVAAAALPACDTTPDSFPLIDMPFPEPRDFARQLLDLGSKD